ncbi:MAG: autotransporter outer membrane beta-barrel domain-containing protein [Pseudomonadota bacterium]
MAQSSDASTAQGDMAGSIGDVCPPINGAVSIGGDPLRGRDPSAPSDAVNLADICTAMVGSAILLREQGASLPEYDEVIAVLSANPELFAAVRGAAFEDLSEIENLEEYLGVLQQINGEEFQTPQSAVTEMRTATGAAIGARMAALRLGAGTGAIAVNLSPDAMAAISGSEAARTSSSLRSQNSAQVSEVFLGRLGVFVTADVRFGDKDATAEADGFDFVAPGVTVGADYRLTDSAVAGLAFTYRRSDIDFDSSINTASGQSLDTDSFMITAYGTTTIGDAAYLEGTVYGGFGDHDSTRRIVISDTSAIGLSNIDERARANTDSTQLGFTLGGGYDFTFGAATVTPMGRIEYIHSSIDGTTESGANGLDLATSDQEIDSFTTQIGLQASYPISTSFGIISPYARGEWFHEFLNDNDAPVIRYASDFTTDSSGAPNSEFTISEEEVDRNYGVLSGGVTVTLPNGMTGFLEGGATVGLENYSVFSVAAGVRFTF